MSSDTERAAATGARHVVPRMEQPAVMVVRTGRGWSVVSPGRTEDVGDLVEGLSLADLVAEELGAPVEADRAARRAVRGAGRDAEDAGVDPRDLRLAALERAVGQLEHALAARVATERAIGVLAERHGTTPRCAFELLRGEARSGGRPVQELARRVLDELETGAGEPGRDRGVAGQTALPLSVAPSSARRSDSGPSRSDGRADAKAGP